MPNVEKSGDKNTGEGIALEGAKTVFVNGRNIMIPGMYVTPHKGDEEHGTDDDDHYDVRTAGGSDSVFAEGLPVIHSMDVDTCGHKRSEPSPDVFVAK